MFDVKLDLKNDMQLGKYATQRWYPVLDLIYK